MVGKDNEYVSHYSAPGAMRAGFEYYRAFPQDAIQNMNYSKTKLTMPVLALGGRYIPTFGGNITMPTIIKMYRVLQFQIQVILFFVVKSLSNFFSGNSTMETSK